MVVDQPDLLEPGLVVETDKADKPVGAGLATEVGTIDLLARDDAGGLVVVMVPAAGAGKDVVGEILQRIGWVRKHRAKKGQDVRGVVLMATVPDEVAYAAAAVAHTVSFKSYRLSVAFDEVDI
jgi:RecB family endonuclease NucS